MKDEKVARGVMVVLAVFVVAILVRSTMFPDLLDLQELPTPAGQTHCTTDYECEHSGYVAEGWIDGFEFVGATRGDVNSWAK